MSRFIITIRKLITNKKYRDELLYIYVLNKFCSDETIIQKMYKLRFDCKLNLDNPETFNEKLQWLKLHNRNPFYTTCVDKYKVREYISDSIGDKYLVPLIATFDSEKEIDFTKLPNKFVLKCNHNSGLGMYICKDKNTLDERKVRAELKKGLKENFYKGAGREWPYKDVKKKIICEEYLEDEYGELRDYKVMCFDGKPLYIELHSGRFSGSHTQDWYDIEWNKKPEFSQPDMPSSNDIVEKPIFLEEMVYLSSVLSKNIPHVRVDWYFAKNQLFFGELTFFDGSGYDPFMDRKIDLFLGKLITLPQKSQVVTMR